MIMNMEQTLLIWLIAAPACLGVLSLLVPRKWPHGKEALLVLSGAVQLALACLLLGKEVSLTLPWSGFGIDFSLRWYHFSGFITFCAAALSLLVSLYTAAFSKGKAYRPLFYACMMIIQALVSGAVLANNLIVLLFFWEAIMGTMYGMIVSNGQKAEKTAVKALMIAGATDLAMMLGIGLTAHLTKTLNMEHIHLEISGWGAVAFALLMTGALSKAGSMPFHTWIPNAADDAPMPFMAFLPGALEKLLGIYLVTRLTLDLFQFHHGSAASLVMMILGVCVIIFAVMMALIQRDFKRLLSYHAVSQVGYMILGIGTALPVGIIGGLFHMLNNAVYKCCLFLTAGAVEKQAGTTNLNKLSGLGKKMPVTMVCFLIAAAAIAGFPMTNGFFSKELIFDGALESGLIFYIIAAIGAFFTPVSFLKLGHAAFFGKTGKEYENVKEAPKAMLLPMVALAAACVALGLLKQPLIDHVLLPVLGGHAAGEHIGMHTNWVLVGVSAGLLLLAVLDHWRGFKKTGRGIESADHFHHAPGLRQVYDLAENHFFDPYYWARGLKDGYAAISLRINDGISWFYDVGVVKAVGFLSLLVKKAHNGNQARYVTWVLAGLVIVASIFLWA